MVFSYHGKPFGRLSLIPERGRKAIENNIQSEKGKLCS